MQVHSQKSTDGGVRTCRYVTSSTADVEQGVVSVCVAHVDNSYRSWVERVYTARFVRIRLPAKVLCDRGQNLHTIFVYAYCCRSVYNTELVTKLEPVYPPLLSGKR
jgi:hypothetical protein